LDFSLAAVVPGRDANELVLSEVAMPDHVVHPRTYWVVFFLLIALTALTIAISFMELGPWHSAIGLMIATGKAALVALFFMHLWYGGRLNWIVLAAALFWLGILLALTMTDYLTRAWLTF
jgi:cytochrome c oxidase subunit 4